MSYEKTNWQNGATPAINANNLNHIEDAIAGLVDAFYPVGSVIITTVNENPGERPFMDNTTWVAWGSGRVPVGVNASDTPFNTAEKTGGSKDAAVVSHTHPFSANTGSAGWHDHVVNGYTSNDGWHQHDIGDLWSDGAGSYDAYTMSSSRKTKVRNTSGNGQHNHYFQATSYGSGDHTHSVSGNTSSSGDAGTNKNLQPYITCYMWKRTA